MGPLVRDACPFGLDLGELEASYDILGTPMHVFCHRLNGLRVMSTQFLARLATGMDECRSMGDKLGILDGHHEAIFRPCITGIHSLAR